MLEINNACCFFGHRDAPYYIIPEIKSNIETLVTECGVTTFYVGNQGRFDSMVVSALKEMKNKYPQISYYIVLAYLPKENENYNAKDTLYPYGIESVPKRFCTSWRNNWMIDNSQYVICYITHITGGAAKFTEKAIKIGLNVINIGKNCD